jgi:hypothetical protein
MLVKKKSRVRCERSFPASGLRSGSAFELPVRRFRTRLVSRNQVAKPSTSRNDRSTVSGFHLASDYPCPSPATCDRSCLRCLAPWAPDCHSLEASACRYSHRLRVGCSSLRFLKNQKLSKNDCGFTPLAGEVNGIVETLSTVFSIECSPSTGPCQEIVQSPISFSSSSRHARDWRVFLASNLAPPLRPYPQSNVKIAHKCCFMRRPPISSSSPIALTSGLTADG